MKQKNKMNTFSDWQSVRMWETRVAADLRQRRMLWLHGLCIGLITLTVTWGASALQMYLGSELLSVRYLASLGVGYGAYLLTVRLWAAALLQSTDNGTSDVSGLDLPDVHIGGGKLDLPNILSGGGGDFGGGGASGDFSGDASGAVDRLGDLVGGAFEAAASSDEGAIVVVPVVTVFLIGCAIFLGAGVLTFMYFGWEVLLAVAVELAFSYATARTAVRVTREGWASAAVRLTRKPLLGAITCAVVLGASIDYYIPTAHSLPQALKILKTQGLVPNTK